jgi:hypothetical protein
MLDDLKYRLDTGDPLPGGLTITKAPMMSITIEELRELVETTDYPESIQAATVRQALANATRPKVVLSKNVVRVLLEGGEIIRSHSIIGEGKDRRLVVEEIYSPPEKEEHRQAAINALEASRPKELGEKGHPQAAGSGEKLREHENT